MRASLLLRPAAMRPAACLAGVRGLAFGRSAKARPAPRPAAKEGPKGRHVGGRNGSLSPRKGDEVQGNEAGDGGRRGRSPAPGARVRGDRELRGDAVKQRRRPASAQGRVRRDDKRGDVGKQRRGRSMPRMLPRQGRAARDEEEEDDDEADEGGGSGGVDFEQAPKRSVPRLLPAQGRAARVESADVDDDDDDNGLDEVPRKQQRRSAPAWRGRRDDTDDDTDDDDGHRGSGTPARGRPRWTPDRGRAAFRDRHREEEEEDNDSDADEEQYRPPRRQLGRGRGFNQFGGGGGGGRGRGFGGHDGGGGRGRGRGRADSAVAAAGKERGQEREERRQHRRTVTKKFADAVTAEREDGSQRRVDAARDAPPDAVATSRQSTVAASLEHVYDGIARSERKRTMASKLAEPERQEAYANKPGPGGHKFHAQQQQQALNPAPVFKAKGATVDMLQYIRWWWTEYERTRADPKLDVPMYYRALHNVAESRDAHALKQAWLLFFRHFSRLNWLVEHHAPEQSLLPHADLLWATYCVMLQGGDPLQVAKCVATDLAQAKAVSSLVVAISEQGMLDDLHDTGSPMPLPVRLECPEFYWKRFVAQWGEERTIKELQAMMAVPPTQLRVNVLKGTQDGAVAALAAEGVRTQAGLHSDTALVVVGEAKVAATQAFLSGRVEVQSEGSQLVAALVGARKGMHVCDLCAGAGGKTLALAASMGNKGKLVASDVDKARLKRAGVRLNRAGVVNVERVVLSGEREDPFFKMRQGAFDRVLVDAPCTSTGTWAVNPDARLRTVTSSSLSDLTDLQDGLLDRACVLVKPGGRLVYATCSLLQAENEDRAKAFLVRHADFTLVPAATVWAEVAAGTEWPCAGQGNDYLRVTPGAHQMEGFFAAVFERRKAPEAPRRAAATASASAPASAQDESGGSTKNKD